MRAPTLTLAEIETLLAYLELDHGWAIDESDAVAVATRDARRAVEAKLEKIAASKQK